MRFEAGTKTRRATERRWTTAAIALLALSVCPMGCAEDDDPDAKSDGKDSGHKPAKPSEPPAPPPIVPTASSFSAIWGSGKNDVWAVGSEGSIVHFDGKELSVI